MTKPATARKVLVMRQHHDASEADAAPVRRYRLARLRFDSRSGGDEHRFAYLKRVYE